MSLRSQEPQNGPLDCKVQIAGEQHQQHFWTGREKYGCCTCGWECAFSESGTHIALRCKQAHERHAKYGIPTIPNEPEPEQAEDSEVGFLDGCAKALDEFESGEDFDERFQDERGHAL
jgi:hypothetical protein